MTAAEALLAGQLEAFRREAERARSEARRYRLAWRSARERAAAYVDALNDACDERDALRAAFAEEHSRYLEVCTELQERVP